MKYWKRLDAFLQQFWVSNVDYFLYLVLLCKSRFFVYDCSCTTVFCTFRRCGGGGGLYQLNFSVSKAF